MGEGGGAGRRGVERKEVELGEKGECWGMERRRWRMVDWRVEISVVRARMWD